MNIIFLNRFYWPEEPATAQLLTDLAEALAAAGQQVTVITSRGSAPACEIHRGVLIHRVRGTRWSRGGVMTKAVDQISHYVCSLMRLCRVANRGGVVVAMTDPPLLGVGAWLIARMRGARIVHWVQDIYPEIAIALTGHRWLAVLRPLRNLAWRRADACVTLGNDMASVPRAAGVRADALHVIPNRAPTGLTPQPDSIHSALLTEWGL
ncbi:MAG: glycosyltransferase, partial [Opitutus sp.]